jgi:hypothetical protein
MKRPTQDEVNVARFRAEQQIAAILIVLEHDTWASVDEVLLSKVNLDVVTADGSTKTAIHNVSIRFDR